MGLRSRTIAARVDPRVGIGGFTLAVAIVVVLVSRAFSVTCPSGVECVTLRELRAGAALPEALHIYDRDGALFAEVAGPLRRSLETDEIPELMSRSFVAVEDRRFWDHGGVDARGILRAAVRNLRDGGISEGASTIPMQLVRTLWAESLRDVGPWRRKVIEARTAPRLIEDLGHERVLTLYLNAIYLGNGLYGVERASQHYFGVGVDSLDLGQVATLVGITRSPEFYDPIAHPDRARSVRGVVLRALVQEGVVDAESAATAAEGDLGLASVEADDRVLRHRTHFTAAVTRELRRVAPRLAGTPGLELHTTIDPLTQRQGEAVLLAQLEAIEAGRYGAYEVEDSTVVLEGAAVALHPRTGEVLAWVGGRDFARSEFDRVEQARRQVGSLVKPLLVASALERGYGVLDLVSADTVPIQTAEGGWLPADHVTETLLPLREALVRSSNRAAAHLGHNLGVESVVQVGRRVGLEGPIPAVPATAIGAFDASLLEMTAAYLPFGNGGLLAEPSLLTRIVGPTGEELWARVDSVGPVRVLDERMAYVVLDAMRAVADRGTGAAVRSTGYRGPAAGKTGTTNDGRDAWFIGLTPEIVAGVWIGFDQPREIVIDRGGGALAAPVWGEWMDQLLRVPRPRTGAWVPPGGLERVRYDPHTGEVLNVDCLGLFGVDFHEAWVITGRYLRRRCSVGVLGWIQRLWEGVTPGDERPLQPVGPIRRRRPGG